MRYLFSFLIPLVFFVIGCSESGPLDESDSPQEPVVDTIRYLALGDSYTIGQSVEVDKRWPNQLADSLSAGGMEVLPVKFIARTGWRTDNLLDAIEKEDLPDTFNLVSLLIGVNNQYQNRLVRHF